MNTVFLDRDGVINVRKDGGYVTSWAEFRFLPGALAGLRRLTAAGYRLVVVTNQSAVNRGLITEPDLAALHDRMCRRIAAAGGRIDCIYYCPHRPEEDCACRKPRPGLILRAAQELGLDPAQCWLIGDDWSDLVAARAAGCRPVLVLTGHGRRVLAEGLPEGMQPILVARDLRVAADLIAGSTLPDVAARTPPVSSDTNQSLWRADNQGAVCDVQLPSEPSWLSCAKALRAPLAAPRSQLSDAAGLPGPPHCPPPVR